MFKRLSLHGTDVKRQAEPHLTDPGDPYSWLAFDWNDLAKPDAVTAFTQPPVQRQRYVYVCPKCFWTLGDPLR
jgi:hypothetical protein